MKIHLAPIHGMTKAFYRDLYDQLFDGYDSYYAPFVSTTHMRKANSPTFADILPKNNKTYHKLIPQLLGNNGADLKFYATSMARMGYKEVNWNIGCPFPSIVRKKRGSGIMPYPEMIQKVLEEVCSDDSFEFSVKMRLGFNGYDEGIQVIEMLNDYPLKNVTIHGRTGIQMYEGVVDLDGFNELYKASKHKIIYNGDILCLNDFKQIQKRFPKIDEFMLGRGALRNPLLASEIKGAVLSAEARKEQIRAFHNAVYLHYTNSCPDTLLRLNKMKEFWTYMSYQIDNNGEFLLRIRRCPTLEAYEKCCHTQL